MAYGHRISLALRISHIKGANLWEQVRLPRLGHRRRLLAFATPIVLALQPLLCCCKLLHQYLGILLPSPFDCTRVDTLQLEAWRATTAGLAVALAVSSFEDLQVDVLVCDIW